MFIPKVLDYFYSIALVTTDHKSGWLALNVCLEEVQKWQFLAAPTDRKYPTHRWEKACQGSDMVRRTFKR